MSVSQNRKRKLNALFLYTLLNEEENESSDNLRDLATRKGKLTTGYFIMVDRSDKELSEFINNAFDNCNKEYVVFGYEEDYLKYRDIIPKSIGLICSCNLYGLGTVTKIMRESQLKNS